MWLRQLSGATAAIAQLVLRRLPLYVSAYPEYLKLRFCTPECTLPACSCAVGLFDLLGHSVLPGWPQRNASEAVCM